ncbi:MAG: phosphatidylinositol-specific phospholipase C/glycerophosphodiester phosphodiesterase family protein [Verrucomicrobiales bacterium]|jgi:hypothetical protein
MVRILPVAGCWMLLASFCAAGEPAPLARAHAHNDYRHGRPLLDALAHGFCSVEADIFLVDGKLLVGHGRGELKEERTLQALYLDPLHERVRANGGRVYHGGPVFTLLIDIKSGGEATYRALAGVLSEYVGMLSEVREGKFTERAVVVIISGNRAGDVIAADNPRYVGIDGRLADLKSKASPHLLPLISDRWGSHFRWRGEGDFSEAERAKLRGIVKSAHGAGRRVRFWATPERVSLWRELREAGVDLINTDDLPGLSEFLRP